MNSVEIAKALINRAKNLQEFEIYSRINEPIYFNGVVPFDISIKDNLATFKVLAVSKEEAKAKVDKWLEDRL
jgi:hypothetical protein